MRNRCYLLTISNVRTKKIRNIEITPFKQRHLSHNKVTMKKALFYLQRRLHMRAEATVTTTNKIILLTSFIYDTHTSGDLRACQTCGMSIMLFQ